MNKGILSITAAIALVGSSFAFADDTTTTTTPTNSGPTTVQLKTSDGKMLNATLDPSDAQSLKNGDKLEVVSVGSDTTPTTDTSTPPTSDTSSTPTTDTTTPVATPTSGTSK